MSQPVRPAKFERQTPLWLRRLTDGYAAGVVLVFFYAVLLLSVSGKSATFDEFRHATAGYSYWKFNDYRLDPENGNLSKRWTALALLTGVNPFPSVESGPWQNAENSQLADQWFNQTGPNGLAMLARGRAASGLIAVALGAVVWWWARRLFGGTGAMLSLLVYASSPIVLANGALMTSDLPVTFFFLLAAWRLDAMFRNLTPTTAVGSALAMGGLFLAKMSAIVIVPVALVMAAVWLVDRRSRAMVAGRPVTNIKAKAGVLAAVIFLHIAAIFTLLWGSFGFRYSAFSDRGPTGRFNAPWEWALDQTDPVTMLDSLKLSPEQSAKASALLVQRGVKVSEWTNDVVLALDAIEREVLSREQAEALARARAAPPKKLFGRLLAFARDHQIAPESYLYGCGHIWRMADKRGAFLNGQFSVLGTRTFFPYVFAVKTPLALLALVGIALGTLVACARGKRDDSAPGLDRSTLLRHTLPLWLLMACYWAAAIASRTNIGHRHLLPVYPPLFILAGAAVYWCRPKWESLPLTAPARTWFILRALPVVLAAVLVAEAAWWFPNYLAYFNGLVPPTQGYRHLVDSSLDWGQDLPSAQRYIATHPSEGPFSLAYFGSADPKTYGIKARIAYRYPDFFRYQSPPFLVINVLQPEQREDLLRKFFAEYPDFDPSFIAEIQSESVPRLLVMKRPEVLRLQPGTFLISASLVQPIFYHKAGAQAWTKDHEAHYQYLRKMLGPLWSQDPAVRLAALGNTNVDTWWDRFIDFEEFRFARLAAYLRMREPDGNINYSILVYHLTPADIARAENGPPPP